MSEKSETVPQIWLVFAYEGAREMLLASFTDEHSARKFAERFTPSDLGPNDEENIEVVQSSVAEHLNATCRWRLTLGSIYDDSHSEHSYTRVELVIPIGPDLFKSTCFGGSGTCHYEATVTAATRAQAIQIFEERFGVSFTAEKGYENVG